MKEAVKLPVSIAWLLYFVVIEMSADDEVDLMAAYMLEITMAVAAGMALLNPEMVIKLFVASGAVRVNVVSGPEATLIAALKLATLSKLAVGRDSSIEPRAGIALTEVNLMDAKESSFA